MQTLSHREIAANEDSVKMQELLREELLSTQRTLAVTEILLEESQSKQKELQEAISQQQQQLLLLLLNADAGLSKPVDRSIDSDSFQDTILRLQADLETERRTSKEEIISCQIEVKNVKELNSALETRLNTVKKENDVLIGKLNDSDQSLKQLAMLNMKVEGLTSDLAKANKECSSALAKVGDLTRQVESYKQLLKIEERNRSDLEKQLDESIAALRQQQLTIQEAQLSEAEHTKCRKLFEEEVSRNQEQLQKAIEQCRQHQDVNLQLSLALNQARAAVLSQQEEMGALNKHIAAVLADNLSPVKVSQRGRPTHPHKLAPRQLFDLNYDCSDISSIAFDHPREVANLSEMNVPAKVRAGEECEREKWKWLDKLIRLSLELHETIAFAFAHSRKLAPAEEKAPDGCGDISNIGGVLCVALLTELSQKHHHLHEAIIGAPWTAKNKEGVGAKLALPELLSPPRDLPGYRTNDSKQIPSITLDGSKNSISTTVNRMKNIRLSTAVTNFSLQETKHIRIGFHENRTNAFLTDSAVNRLEDRDSVRLPNVSGEFQNQPLAASTFEDNDESLLFNVSLGGLSFTSGGAPELISQNRSYSFTNRELHEESFESAMSEIWNISTDNENIDEQSALHSSTQRQENDRKG